MPLQLFAAPPTEPVSLAEQKLHMRVDGNAEDAKITALIIAARERIEAETWRAMITQAWDVYLDAFPGDQFELPLAPLQSVTYLKYTDQDGVLQTLVAGTDYIVDAISDPGRIVVGYQKSWPIVRTIPNAIVARIICGYAGAAKVPGSLKLAIQMLAAEWFENRELAMMDEPLPNTVHSLIGPYRVVRF